MSQLIVNPFATFITTCRAEEPMCTVINQAKKFRVDSSLIEEIRSYRIFNQKDIFRVKGPEDFDVLLDIFDTIQRHKDRVCEMQLVYMSWKNDIDRLYKIVHNFLILRREVINLKNDTQRIAIIEQIIPEVIEVRDAIDGILTASEHIIKNLNNTYNIGREQSVAVQQKMYWRKLTLPDSKPMDRS